MRRARAVRIDVGRNSPDRFGTALFADPINNCMSNLTISERKKEDVVILDLKGKIKLGDENINLHQALRKLADNGEKKVLLNLAEVTNIDSSGLGELVAGYTSLEKDGGEMKLLHLTDHVAELMMITKLLTVFDVFDNEEIALTSFGGSASETSA